MTGAGWRTRRTGMSDEIPRQHWHSDDPGSVPNVRINGAGAPSGIAMYDGTLLPKRYWGTLIHADPGPNEVRAYPVHPSGAGYVADVLPVVSSRTDKMFRPVDVAVAPDGSLFVADWYDAGVGGHNMSDQTQGRIIRIAPPNTPYTVPALDLTTTAGAARALNSPNHATRYLAYEKLHAAGRGAENVLAAMYRGTDARARARALWLLARIPGRGARYLDAASRDADPNIRVVALRATRRIGVDVIPIASRLVKDPAPEVRREVAIALRHEQSPRAAAIWADLAAQHDGADRWYLEALGVSADRQWDRYFGAWLDRVGNGWNTAGGRDIVWRARSTRALPLLQQLATDASIPVAERLRYFRAFDFYPAEDRQRALLAILATPAGSSAELTPVILGQLDAKAASGNEDVQGALQRTLPSIRGTTKYVDLVERFDARAELDQLIQLALDKPSESAGVEAARLALAWGGAPRFAQIVRGSDERAARRALVVLGRNYTPAVDSVVTALALDTTRALDLRRAAVQSMGSGYNGWQRIVALARTNRLPAPLKPTAATALFSAWPELRDSAAKYGLAPAPATTLDGRTLPPLMVLAERGGDAPTGQAVFTRTCSACHLAAGTGTDFGPALTEIGDKLPKSGLLLAILDPSAGIAFGYEGWSVRTNDGQQLVGMISSETDDEIVMKLIGGTQRRVPKSTITERKRMDTSLMPQGLERTMTEADLTNLVEYLSSLHKPR
jgi:putative heme-binding domain-containing protein